MFYSLKKYLNKYRNSLIFLVFLFLVVGTVFVSYPNDVLAAVSIDGAGNDGKTLPPSDTAGCGEGITSFLEIGCLIARINGWIGWAAGWMIMLVMSILEIALEINGKVLQLPAVQLGWSFTRDVANMGFVLGMIVIAFATILRSQSYGVKQLIVRLIVAAVAVNLSLSVAGVFMDVAAIPTQFFMDKITGPLDSGPGGFSKTLSAAFNIQNIETINVTSQTTLSGTAKATGIVASVFFSLIFSFVILITLMTLTYMFLHRFIALAILMILMPLAILSWVFPGLRGRWSTWLGKFMQWTFFAPISMFFLHLAVYTVKAQGGYITSAANTLKTAALGSGTAFEQSILIGTNDPVLLVTNMVLMVLLTLGGLFAAQSMSIQGASYGMKLATSGSQRILRGGTTVPAAAVGRWAGNRAMTYGSTVGEDGKSTTNSYAQSMATRLASVKVAGMNVGRFFSGASEKINKKVTEVQKGAEEQRTRFDTQTKSYRAATLDRLTTVANPEMASGLLLAMAKKGELRDADPEKQKAIDEKITELLGKLIETNSGKEFASYLPEYASVLGQEISKIMPKTNTETYAEMKASTFKSDSGDSGRDKAATDAVLYASSSGLKTIADRNPEAVGEIMKTFEKIRLSFEGFDEAKTRKDIADNANSTDEKVKEQVKADNKKLLEYSRYRTQKEILYTDPGFSGAAVNQKTVESFRDERFARMNGGGGNQKRTEKPENLDERGRRMN